MQKSRKPAPRQESRPSHITTDTDDSTTRCPKGCPWRGECPVHSLPLPNGFDETRCLMRGPVRNRRAVRVVK